MSAGDPSTSLPLALPPWLPRGGSRTVAVMRSGKATSAPARACRNTSSADMVSCMRAASGTRGASQPSDSSATPAEAAVVPVAPARNAGLSPGGVLPGMTSSGSTSAMAPRRVGSTETRRLAVPPAGRTTACGSTNTDATLPASTMSGNERVQEAIVTTVSRRSPSPTAPKSTPGTDTCTSGRSATPYTMNGMSRSSSLTRRRMVATTVSAGSAGADVSVAIWYADSCRMTPARFTASACVAISAGLMSVRSSGRVRGADGPRLGLPLDGPLLPAPLPAAGSVAATPAAPTPPPPDRARARPGEVTAGGAPVAVGVSAPRPGEGKPPKPPPPPPPPRDEAPDTEAEEPPPSPIVTASTDRTPPSMSANDMSCATW